jgi:CrcB protein
MDCGRSAVSSDAAHAREERRSLALLYLAVAIGSVVGSVLRWGVSLAAPAWLGALFPWGTLFANVTGSLAIGFYARLTAPGGRLFASPRMRHFVMTGVCGGYTTFSVFSLETLQLAPRAPILAAAYAMISIAAWLLAVWLGDALAARINRLKGAQL